MFLGLRFVILVLIVALDVLAWVRARAGAR